MKSKRIKLIRQSDSIDCGPTCLSIISSAYKKNFSVEKIKDLCGLSAEGVSLLGISRAAEIIGFRTIGGKTTISSLLYEVPLPCIVHWNQNHFIVVYKDTVLISNKKELRKINCRHFVFLYVFSLMGASRPLAPRCFQV